MNGRKPALALVPDRFAHYRYPVFKLLSDEARNGVRVVIYADSREDFSRIKLVNEEYCNTNFQDGGILWKRIRSFYIRNICFWQTGLVKLSVSRDYEIIVYWGEAHRLSTWISAIVARVAGKKVAFWTHGIYGNEGFFKRKIRTWFYQLAHVLLVYGEHGKRQLSKAGLPANRLFVINNSLDVDAQLAVVRSFSEGKLAALRNRYCQKHERLLVFVGRLEESKRLDLLLHALSHMKSKGIAVRGLLIGDGTMKGQLQALTYELGVARDVIFYGECYEEEVVLPLLAVSDICVSPGEVGLTAMHALVCGTPVITHDDFSNQMPECEAIKVGESGGFFRRGDAEDLAEKLCACLSAIEKGEITSESCRKIIQNKYTPEFQRSVFYEAIRPLFS